MPPRRIAALWLSVPLALTLASSHATPPALKSATAPDSQQSPVLTLNGPWRFRTGDDPGYASPAFDDSAWQLYLLDSEHPDISATNTLTSPELPGWQQHGHPRYTGYAWYRIHLELPLTGKPLALLMPPYVDDAYTVYLDGREIGGFGHLDGRIPAVYSERALLFPLPARSSRGGNTITLAIRFWSKAWEITPKNLNGGLRSIPLIGPVPLLDLFFGSFQDQAARKQWTRWLYLESYGSVGLIALFLFSLSHRRREYLWAGVAFSGIAAANAVRIYVQRGFVRVELASTSSLVLQLLGFFAAPLAVMYLLEVPRLLWRRLNFVVLAGGILLVLINLGLLLNLVPPNAASGPAGFLAGLWSFVAPSLLVLLIAVHGVRVHGRSSWIALSPGLFFVCGMAAAISRAYFKTSLLPVILFIAAVPLANLVVFLLRFVQQQEENVRLTEDIHQAQAVQHLLIPEDPPDTPGLHIHAEYRPAREVGGDFFQVLPDPTDGSTLVVVGDVTGKGLPAGMTVALLVGAIRTEAAHTRSPVAILEALNQRLLGRSDSFATALALRISATRAVTLANAGHLPPFLNAAELDLPGSLPLGLVSSADLSTLTFQLHSGDRLLFLSDGVPEAQNRQGELFGFPRIAALLQQSASAYTLATSAQAFSKACTQADDILVLEIHAQLDER